MKRIAPSDNTLCPMCFHPGHISEDYFVEWDESKKEFRVVIALYCWPCHYRWNERLTKTLPLIIAEQSRCSCGAQLRLADFSVVRAGDGMEFRGVYVCGKCNAKDETFWGHLKEAVAALWRSTKKIEVGPTGVKFEKEVGPSPDA